MKYNTDLKEILPELINRIRPDEVIMLFYQSWNEISISFSSSFSNLSRYKLYQVNRLKGLGSTAGYIISNETAEKLASGLLPLKNDPDGWEQFYKMGLINGIRVVYPFIMENSYAPTTINGSFNRNGLMKRVQNFAEDKKVFPIYQILRARRQKNLSKRRKCIIVPNAPIDLRITN